MISLLKNPAKKAAIANIADTDVLYHKNAIAAIIRTPMVTFINLERPFGISLWLFVLYLSFPLLSAQGSIGFAWKSMYLNLYNDVQAWLQVYHQRSHCESFHSGFKRVCGIITKIRFCCKLAQVTARIILHNRKRLSYFNKLAEAS